MWWSRTQRRGWVAPYGGSVPGAHEGSVVVAPDVAGAGVRSIGGFLAPAGFDDSGQGPPEAVGVESDEPAVGEWTDVPDLVVVGVASVRHPEVDDILLFAGEDHANGVVVLPPVEDAIVENGHRFGCGRCGRCCC